MHRSNYVTPKSPMLLSINSASTSRSTVRASRAALKDVRLQTIQEGRCVQMLHVGPYDREPCPQRD